jgi:cytochrome c-type biogenesis protein CcmH/NrfF
MHYIWFIPVFALVVVGVWLLYLVAARGQPEHPERSVDGAHELERAEDEAAAKRAAKQA